MSKIKKFGTSYTLSLLLKKSFAACIFSLFLGAGIFLPVSFSSAADITWTGATSNDWGTNTNWSTSAVPTSADNVTIPDASTTANDPSISTGAVCNNLTIAVSGILDGNGQTVTVYSDWTNSGTFNHGGGVVKFVGGGNSNFTSGASVYNSLEIDKTNTSGYDKLYVSGTVAISGNLVHTNGRMLQGQIDLAGNYLIGANANGGDRTYADTKINFNHASNNQSIIYTAGGQGSTVRIDKAGGTFIINSDIKISGWEYVQGAVSGPDIYTITFAGDGHGTFTPGALTYSNIIINKTDATHHYLFVSGTTNVSGNLTHTNGRILNGQINLAGNYIVGASADTGNRDNPDTIINFNHASNDQSIIYAAGGECSHIRVDKVGGTFSISTDITVGSWTYVQGTVSGVSNHTITFGGGGHGTFAQGALTYSSIVINKTDATHHYLTVGSGTLNITGNLTFSSGHLYLNTNNPTVNISGDVSISSGAEFYAGTNPITVNGNWTNSGTFSHGNGKIVFRGSVDTTFTPGASSYYDMEVDKSGYDDLNISGTATVLGDLIQTDGDIGQGQINLAGDYIIAAGSGGGTGYYLSTVVNFNGTGDQAIVYNAGGTGAQIRVDKPSGTLTISDDIIICGWIYISGTVVGYDTHTLIFGDDNHGTFTPGALTYVNLELRKQGGYSELQFSGTTTVTGTFTHTDGELANGQMNLSGNYIIGAAAGGGSSYYNATIINLNGTGNQTITYSAGGIGGHIRIDKSSGTLTMPADLNVNSWTYVQGTVSGFSGGTLTFGDDNQGTFIPGTLAYNNITVSVGGIYNNFTFGSGTFSFNTLTVTSGKLYLSTNNPTISLSGNMSVSASGTVYAGTNPITVYGDWSNSGTFNHGNGKIIFRGNTDKTFTPGSSQYYDVDINKTSMANVVMSGTAIVSNNLIHTDGELRSGQIDVWGNYVIGASAEGVHCGYQAVRTVVNLNHATNDQQIVYSAGGIGAQVRVDKAGGNLTISDDIIVTGWVYIQGNVLGLDTHRLILGDNYHGDFTPGSLVYSEIELNKTYPGGYNQLSINGTATVTGNFISTDGEVDDGQINLGGDYIIGPSSEGEVGGYGAARTYINFNNASSDQRITYSSGGIGATIRVDKAGGNLIVSSDIDVSGWVYVQGTVVGLDTYDLIMRDNGHGTFSPGSMTYGNVVIDRYGANYYEFTMGAGTANIAGDLSLVDGIIRCQSNNPSINLAGNLSLGSLVTFTKGTGTITFTGTAPSTFTDSSATPQNIGKIVVGKTNADSAQNTLTLLSGMTCDTLTVNTNNTLDLGTGGRILTLANAGATANVLTLNGSLDKGDGTVKFSATNSAGSINLPFADYENLELVGSETYVLTDNTDISGDLTISAVSTLNTATFDLALSGNFTNSGTFTANNNVVTLDGADQILSGDTSFYDLTKTIASADTLTFQSGSTTTVGHALTLEGGDRTSRLSLRSGTADTQWNLVLSEDATYDFDYLDVQDSNASRTLTVLNSLDSGNNTNWSITNNTAPIVTVPTISQNGSIVTIQTTVSDTDHDNISLKIEYSTDNSTWYDPYLSGISPLDNAQNYQISSITTAAPNTISFSWDTRSEQNGSVILYEESVFLRITPYDGTDIGTAKTSASFLVNNRSAVFIPPVKPDISGLQMSSSDDRLTFNNLPDNIVQMAVSTTPDFQGSSFQNLQPVDLSLYTGQLYLKFRTNQGAVSDTIVYTIGTSVLKDGDIVKTPDSFDVYIIKYKNNKQYKRLILSPHVFSSYRHLDWNNLKTISQLELDRYITSDLVKETYDTIIYQLTPDGDTGERRVIDQNKSYDRDSVYEINATDRDAYRLVG